MITRSLLRRAGVFALAVSGLGLAVAPLAADGANAPVRRVGSTPRSGSFAGYNFQTGDYGTPPSVVETTTFVVPRLKCARADQGIAPNFGAFVGDAGRPSAAVLVMRCHGGKAHYWPQLELKYSIKNYPTKVAYAGDTIVLRLAYDHKAGSVSVADETHRFKVTRTGSGIGGGILDAWIGDRGCQSHGRLEAVPDFGTLTYSRTMIDGRPLGSSGGGYFLAPSDRGSRRTLQIKTGAFFSGGTQFRTYFKHS